MRHRDRLRVWIDVKKAEGFQSTGDGWCGAVWILDGVHLENVVDPVPETLVEDFA